jgi:hypothetical protein
MSRPRCDLMDVEILRSGIAGAQVREIPDLSKLAKVDELQRSFSDGTMISLLDCSSKRVSRRPELRGFPQPLTVPVGPAESQGDDYNLRAAPNCSTVQSLAPLCFRSRTAPKPAFTRVSPVHRSPSRFSLSD